ncbi:malonate decarboxylase acyl carrier protein [Cloacibacillus sp. An23]|uniref:malonate decarboxylase acyl carrier protein n=1 Tax=Cloacibacillus sp. An23 TaxID=1965591 RepID=UPI000B3681E4|nr:malonate decarboxylase acyl carrier protein [Cloacibacillus sp. An23]OUO92971.1 malonate decarboxylase acyl carrier protein [Cloacibacillus sp. An23]
MALQTLYYEFKVADPKSIPAEWGHYGVTGSGDLEVLFERQNLNGSVKVKVVTPVKGFEKVWEKVLERFVKEFSLGDLSIEINDDNATPVVVYMRLRQGLVETGFLKGE